MDLFAGKLSIGTVVGNDAELSKELESGLGLSRSMADMLVRAEVGLTNVI